MHSLHISRLTVQKCLFPIWFNLEYSTKKEMFWRYILSGLFLITGLFLLNFGFRKRSPQEKIEGKELPPSGGNSKVHIVFLGIFLTILSVTILFI